MSYSALNLLGLYKDEKMQSRIISRERGKHPVEVVATPDAEKLLAMLFK